MRDVPCQTSKNAPNDDNSNEDLPERLQQEDTMSVHSAGNQDEVKNDIDLSTAYGKPPHQVAGWVRQKYIGKLVSYVTLRSLSF